MVERTGVPVFRNFVNSKDQKPAFKNDLNAFLDKFQEQPSMISNGSFLSLTAKENESRKRSPSIAQPRLPSRHEEQSRRKTSHVSSLCNSRSKNKTKSAIADEEIIKDCQTYRTIRNQETEPKVKGKSMFADATTLSKERLMR